MFQIKFDLKYVFLKITRYYEKIHIRREDYNNRVIYHNDLDVCLNYRFQQMYNLSLTTSIEYCENSERTEKLGK